MDIIQLNCFNFSEHIKISNCCIWSEDNTVAVIGTKGVNILGFVSDFLSKKNTLKVYGRSKINISQNFPAYNFGISVDKLVPSLDNKEKYRILMNGLLTPHVDESVVCVHQIRWSPRFICSCRCMLGVLTNHGSLELLVKDALNWNSACDIGIEWKKYLLEHWNRTDGSTTFSRDLFLNRFKQLRIVAFTWTQNFVIDDKLHCILIVGHNDGKLSVWKLKEDPDLIVLFSNTMESGLDERIESMYWFEISNDAGWLVITTVDGTVNLYSCKWNDNFVSLSISYLSTIWCEKDHIRVSSLLIKSRQDDILFVMSKERSVIVILLSPMGINLQQTFFRFSDYRITGLDIINDSQLFVLLVGGKFCLLTIKDASKQNSKDTKCLKSSLSLTREDIVSHLNYTLDGSFTFGVAFSPNKMFCVFVASISGLYDHLITRDPSSLILCSMYSDIQYPINAIKTRLYKESFYDMQDCFELIRIHFTESDVATFGIDLLNNCNPFTSYPITTATMTPVHVFYWFNKILKNKNIDCLCTKEYDLEKLEIVMIMINIFRYVHNVTSLRQQYLIREWVTANISKLPENCQNLVETATDLLYRFNDIKHVESCTICSSKVVVLDQVRYVKCTKNHVMLRCTHSLIPVGTNRCRNCPCCSSIVLASEDVHQCIFCDGLLYERAK